MSIVFLQEVASRRCPFDVDGDTQIETLKTLRAEGQIAAFVLTVHVEGDAKRVGRVLALTPTGRRSLQQAADEQALAE